VTGQPSSSCRDDRMNKPLTDEAFWDDIWSTIELPALIDEKVRWQLALAKVFRRFLKPDTRRDVFEIACAPGQWLVWFNKNFGYTAFGCASRAGPRRLRHQISTSTALPARYTRQILRRGAIFPRGSSMFSSPSE
jgi:hypothetical protein